ncbi:MAG: PaaI family thioesterase [Mycobacteriales bacterium]
MQNAIAEHSADRLARLARGYDGLEFLHEIADGELPPPPIADLIGFGIRHIEHGRVTFAMQPRLEHYNPIGMVHGGVAATLLDTVLGCAVHTKLPAGTGYTTLDLQVRYLRPVTVRTGTVLATGTVVHLGRRTATAQAELVAEDTGSLLATATSSLLVLQP